MNFDLVVRSLLCKIFAAHFKLYSLSQQNLIGIFIVSALKYGQHNLCNKVKNGLLEIFKIIGLSEMPKLFYWFFKNTKNEKRKRYLSRDCTLFDFFLILHELAQTNVNVVKVQ